MGKMKGNSERGCGNSDLRKENLPGVVTKCEDAGLESVGSQAF